jgi:hypothetical protein
MVALVSMGLFSQTHVVHMELGQAWGGGAEVDIDGDGDLDFYIAGNKNNPMEPLLDPDGNPIDYENDGVPDTTERWQRLYLLTEAGFTETSTNLRVVDRANLSWADINGDGLVDLFATEHSFNDYDKPDDPWYNGGVYTNNGDGTFNKLDWPLYERSNAGAFGDFNNDGHMDYVAISADSAGSFVYMNNGDDTFTQTNGDVLGEYKFGIPYLELADFNNDGLVDIFITSNCDNPATNAGARVICDVFINNDEEPGTFYRTFIGDNGVNQKGNGGVDIADFNSDGYLDFALHGEGGAGTPEPAGGGWECISHLYINQQDGSFVDKPQPNFRADLRPLNSSGVATRTIDWNQDGNYDLILSGWEPEPGPVTQTGYFFAGDGAGNFTEGVRVPGGSETIILFNDWNGDGVLDFLSSGHCWDAMWYTPDVEVGRTASVFFNTNTSAPNTRPGAPANLASEVGTGKVTLSWDAGTDDNTAADALSYEYYLKDGSGNFVMAPASHVGGDLDGVRMILNHGNLFLNKELELHDLAPGEYTWSVQAIDASYEGSAWAAEASFTITNVSVEQNPLEKQLKVYTRYNELVVQLDSHAKAKLSVFNLLGQEMDRALMDGEYRSSLPSGVYAVKVESQGHICTRKVVIE